MRLKYKNILLSTIFAIISIFVVNFKISTLAHYDNFEDLVSRGFVFSFSGTLLVLCLIILSHQKTSKILELLLALIFGILNVIGHYVETYDNMVFPSINIVQMLIIFGLIVGYTVIFYCVILTFERFVDWILKYNHLMLDRLIKSKLNPIFRLTWIKTLILIFLLWLPVLVILLPGTMAIDGQRQMDEFFRTSIPSISFKYFPTNHHPWIASLWQGFLMKIGMTLSGGNVNYGLLVHSVFLMVISLMSYSYLAMTVKKYYGQLAGLLTVIFLGLYPHFVNYAMLYDKTGWYQAFFIVFFVSIFRYLMSEKRATLVFCVIISGILTSLFRSNGFMIVFVVMFSMLILIKQRKQIFVMTLLIILPVMIWSHIALPALNVMPASPGERMNVQFQQISRIYLLHHNNFSTLDKKTLSAVIPLNKIKDNYNSQSADGIKEQFFINSFLITYDDFANMKGNWNWYKSNAYKNKIRSFNHLWLKMLLKYPKDAAFATLKNKYIDITPSLNRGNDISTFTGGLSNYVIINNQWTAQYEHFISDKNAKKLSVYYSYWAKSPILNLLVNTGLYTWLAIALGVFWFKRRKTRELPFVIGVILVVLINFAGARNGDFRYCVPFVALTPIIVGIIINNYRSRQTIYYNREYVKKLTLKYRKRAEKSESAVT